MNKILTSIMFVGFTGILIGGAAFAAFTATATNTGNVFSTGTLNLTTSPSSGFISMSNMKPGDTVNATLNVTNPGTLSETYNITGNVAGEIPFITELQLQVLNGATPYYGPGTIEGLTSGHGQIPLTSNTTNNMTFIVTLPTGAPNTVQGQTANATFTFNGVQQ